MERLNKGVHSANSTPTTIHLRGNSTKLRRSTPNTQVCSIIREIGRSQIDYLPRLEREWRCAFTLTPVAFWKTENAVCAKSRLSFRGFAFGLRLILACRPHKKKG